MAFPGHHLPLRLSVLLLKALLLPANPPQASNHGQPDGFIIKAKWCGYPNTALRRVHAYVEVLDVLAYNLHGDAAHFDGVAFSNHAGSRQSDKSHPRARHPRRAQT